MVIVKPRTPFTFSQITNLFTFQYGYSKTIYGEATESYLTYLHSNMVIVKQITWTEDGLD